MTNIGTRHQNNIDAQNNESEGEAGDSRIYAPKANGVKALLQNGQKPKFEKSVFEAIGVYPERPPQLKNLESLDQRYEVFNSDTDQVKNFIINNS